MSEPTKPTNPAKPNPSRHDAPDATPNEMAVARRLHCRLYDECLDQAIACDWPGFHCGNCTAYAPQEPHREAFDLVGLCALYLRPELEEAEEAERARLRRGDAVRAA
jgi:hypothetical protein